MLVLLPANRDQLHMYLSDLRSRVLEHDVEILDHLRDNELRRRSYALQKVALDETIAQLGRVRERDLATLLKESGAVMRQAISAMEAALQRLDQPILLVSALKLVVELAASAVESASG
jgi:hypothetical protein